MSFKFFQKKRFIGAILMLWSLQAQASTGETHYITLNGQSFEIVLEPTNTDRYGIPDLEASSQFFYCIPERPPG